jgi:hypothetical protein
LSEFGLSTFRLAGSSRLDWSGEGLYRESDDGNAVTKSLSPRNLELYKEAEQLFIDSPCRTRHQEEAHIRKQGNCQTTRSRHERRALQRRNAENIYREVSIKTALLFVSYGAYL